MGPSLPGPIPWETVQRWSARNHLDEDESDLLDEVLGTLADFDLRWTVERLPKPKK